ncbi:PQQ-binding-like beta-propeller repeat protein [Actinoplanes hulinensis]|uniref:PQQ-binding-like beta-propeller repeat protein n=1 Tax=Actinoplanes hulinensis TaxID=1144547 RepID=A0ABS7B5G7_9ACTN|nr:PQQ-binding-like beta-propeller repeat protein [Actinoplanes hulinensis]MBW6436205.1 PQQ-binding-like beta-propeller repeat protein [Actinoplanes hulinensis]
MTLIELDRDAPLDPESPRRTPPPWRYRHLGLILSAALAMTLGGAALPGGTFWRYLGLIPASAGTDAPIQLAGGRLFTVVSSGQERTLTAWAPKPEPYRMWSAALPVSADYDPASGLFGPVSVRAAGGVLLVTDGPGPTTALDPENGRALWTSAGRVTTAGDTAFTVDRIFRPGTLYDQESGDPGMLYFSADGQPHTEPPERTEVRGLDLGTGETLWTASSPGSVTADPVAGSPRAVLVTASERLILLDAATGRVLREKPLPQVDGAGPSTASVLGDLALVGYQGVNVQLGYDARTLERRWKREIVDDPAPADCDGLLCSRVEAQTAVLDPATGDPKWFVPADTRLTARAGGVLFADGETGAPIHLIDSGTAAPLVGLRGWTEAVDGPPERMLLLRRYERGGGKTFGIVLAGQSEVTVLGTTGFPGNECVGDDRYVVCRDTGGLRVWAYRA